jgi:hypothetical protein
MLGIHQFKEDCSVNIRILSIHFHSLCYNSVRSRILIYHFTKRHCQTLSLNAWHSSLICYFTKRHCQTLSLNAWHSSLICYFTKRDCQTLSINAWRSSVRRRLLRGSVRTNITIHLRAVDLQLAEWVLKDASIVASRQQLVLPTPRQPTHKVRMICWLVAAQQNKR